jgi:hypothetical protein
MLESCTHSKDGPDFYVTAIGGRTGDDGSHIGVWKTEEQAQEAARAGGFLISSQCPHDPGTRRQFVRPPYPW